MRVYQFPDLMCSLLDPNTHEYTGAGRPKTLQVMDSGVIRRDDTVGRVHSTHIYCVDRVQPFQQQRI